MILPCPGLVRFHRSKMILIAKGCELNMAWPITNPARPKFVSRAHAYQGSVSYLDDLVGRLTTVLGKTGLDENTIVVFTSDHGDMLGERGLWYKKSFFEDSCRIPLIISGGGLPQSNCDANVSLVDLLPTLLSIAGDETGDNLVEPIEGNSLWGLLTAANNSWDKPVYSENLAEGAKAPILMVKQGSMKYVASGIDPEQLFDLEKDPDELDNLIGNADYQSEHQILSDLLHSKWDMTDLTVKVELSQKRRLFLRQALREGKTADWDYSAPDQLVEHCLRGSKLYNDWAYNSVLDLRFPEED